MSNKLLIIGIDGATFRIIKPLVEEGKLPTFARLMKNGTHGILRSTVPPITAPAWSSFMTGKNPGKHGLFHFTRFKEGSYDYSLVNATVLKSKTMFRLASDAGKKVISINVPMTYPPEKLNGIMVGGMLSPRGMPFTYPESLSQRLTEDGYIIDLIESLDPDPLKHLEPAKEMARQRLNASKILLGENKWDLGMVVFVGMDRLQHNLWDHMDILKEFYIYQDALLAELLDVIDDSTYIMMMSDHGFTPVKGAFFVNQWLKDQGYLKQHWWKVHPPVMINDLVVGRQWTFKYRVKQLIKRVVATITRGKLLKYPQISINYEKSRAFATPSEIVYINLKGREAAGKVEQGEEYESLKREIAEKLRNATDPLTGEKLLEDAIIKDDMYSGDCYFEAPDIGLVPKDDGYAFVGLQAYHSPVMKEYKTRACHSMDGVFFLSGPDTTKGDELKQSDIVDCMPTALHILDIPVPDDVDGKVLKDCFRDGTPMKKRETKTQGSSQITDKEFKSISDKDEKLMQEQLKGLGYLT